MNASSRFERFLLAARSFFSFCRSSRHLPRQSTPHRREGKRGPLVTLQNKSLRRFCAEVGRRTSLPAGSAFQAACLMSFAHGGVRLIHHLLRTWSRVQTLNNSLSPMLSSYCTVSTVYRTTKRELSAIVNLYKFQLIQAGGNIVYDRARVRVRLVRHMNAKHHVGEVVWHRGAHGRCLGIPVSPMEAGKLQDRSWERRAILLLRHAEQCKVAVRTTCIEALVKFCRRARIAVSAEGVTGQGRRT